MPRGGKREGSGRRKALTAKLPAAVVDQGFATRVLERIGEGCPKEIKSAEDFQLTLIYSSDIQTSSYNFNRCLDRKYGKPAQGVFSGDTRENARELDFGNLPMPASPEPRAAGKPN